MSKPHPFGILRMMLANMLYDKEKFLAYLKGEGYGETELQAIREAFLSIGKEGEIKPGTIFGGEK